MNCCYLSVVTYEVYIIKEIENEFDLNNRNIVDFAGKMFEFEGTS